METGIFPGGSDGKESACSVEDPGLIPGLGRSSGERNGNSLQYSCLGNPMDRGGWWVTVHGVTRVRHNLTTKPPPQSLEALSGKQFINAPWPIEMTYRVQSQHWLCFQ